jgi:hypothetical protein
LVSAKHEKNSYKSKQWRPPSKKKQETGKNLSPRNRKACHRVGTALLKSVAEIGTQSAMKSSKKTLHEFTASHIPQKMPKRKRSRSTNKLLYTNITFRAQGARVSGTHAREAT